MYIFVSNHIRLLCLVEKKNIHNGYFMFKKLTIEINLKAIKVIVFKSAIKKE